MSPFIQVIVPPVRIVAVVGIKQSGSHPGVEEPGALFTTAFEGAPPDEPPTDAAIIPITIIAIIPIPIFLGCIV